MDSLEEPLKEPLGRNAAGIWFASVFGSFTRGNHNPLSDIDVLLVCEDEAHKPAISNSLARLGLKIGREIHVNIYSSKDFEDRIQRHDYLIASILDDSGFVFGDEDAFFEGKRRILTGLPNSESAEFNRRMGLKMLNRADDHLRLSISCVVQP